MPGYRSTEQTVLIELLSTLTADYTRLLTENGDRQQLDKLHKEIVAVQQEIGLRQKLNKYSDPSNDFILINDGDIV